MDAIVKWVALWHA